MKTDADAGLPIYQPPNFGARALMPALRSDYNHSEYCNADIVVWLYHQMIAGVGTSSIARQLSDRAILSQGRTSKRLIADR